MSQEIVKPNQNEDPSNTMIKTTENETWWDKNWREALLAALFVIFSWWVLHPFINSGMVAMTGVANSPERQGLLGDSYGSLKGV